MYTNMYKIITNKNLLYKKINKIKFKDSKKRKQDYLEIMEINLKYSPLKELELMPL